MKVLIAVLVTLSGVSAFALDCASEARSRTNLNPAQTNQLCSGATTIAPVDCFVDATARLTIFTANQNVRLCSGAIPATSQGLVDCAYEIRRRTALGNDEIVNICLGN